MQLKTFQAILYLQLWGRSIFRGHSQTSRYFWPFNAQENLCQVKKFHHVLLCVFSAHVLHPVFTGASHLHYSHCLSRPPLLFDQWLHMQGDRPRLYLHTGARGPHRTHLHLRRGDRLHCRHKHSHAVLPAADGVESGSGYRLLARSFHHVEAPLSGVLRGIADGFTHHSAMAEGLRAWQRTEALGEGTKSSPGSTTCGAFKCAVCWGKIQNFPQHVYLCVGTADTFCMVWQQHTVMWWQMTVSCPFLGLLYWHLDISTNINVYLLLPVPRRIFLSNRLYVWSNRTAVILGELHIHSVCIGFAYQTDGLNR